MSSIPKKRSIKFSVLIITMLLLLSACAAGDNSMRTPYVKTEDTQSISVTEDITSNVISASTANNQLINKPGDSSFDSLNSQKVEIKYYKSKGTYDYTWPSIYKNFIVFANHPKVMGKTQTIHFVDTNSNSEKIIYSSKDNIDDVKMCESRVYWIEGYSCAVWAIMAYNVESKEIIKIRDSESESKHYTLVPRINNDNKKLFWIEGYTDNENNLHHELFMFDPDINKIEQLASVNYLDNPYQILIPRNNYVSFADKVNDKWVIRIIDITNRKESTVDCDSIPVRPVCDGNIVIWSEGEINDNFYLFDIAKNKKTLFEHRVDYADIIDNCIVYSKGFQLYKYYKALNKTICLSESLKNNNENLTMWFSCYNNTIVVIKDIAPGNSEIAIIIDNNR